MSNLIPCPNCEIPYLPGEAQFCPNCGTALPKVNMKSKSIRSQPMETELRPYQALRFIAALIMGGGWVIIILGWALVILYYALGASVLIDQSTLDGFPVISPFIPFIFLFLDTLFGVLVIGAGQVYSVILDIRDDMHSTMQYVRLGVRRSEVTK